MGFPKSNSPDDRDASLDNAKKELREASSEFWETPSPSPEQLFHYCSADALHSIMAGRKLWLSDVFTLSDASEIVYGVDVVNGVLEGQSHRPGWLPSRLNPSKLREVLPLYVACFCSQGDLLGQWRGYTTAGSGFAIGFNRERLEQHCSKNDVALPIPVIYDAERHARGVKKFVDGAIQTAVKHSLTEPSFPDFAEEFVFWLSSFLLGMKNACFTEEKEWRILRIKPEPPDLKFRVGRGVIIPYIEMSSIPANVFSSVTLGPAVDPKFWVKPLELFLKHNQMEHVDLRPSRIPLRTLRY